MDDLIITGLPRSGTTLLCRLLCEHDNMIALNEPMDNHQFESPVDALRNIADHFERFRSTLLKNGTAVARTKDGAITDNAYTPDSRSRGRQVKRTEILFSKPLDQSFTLAMKHCAEFSLLLPDLANQYLVFAMIRNPLALLGSWNTVNVPVSRGEVGKSKKINPALYSDLENFGDDLVGKQLFILSWYFEQYRSIPTDNVIRYEDLISAPADVISRISNNERSGLYPELHNKNTNEYYNREALLKLGQRLLGSEGSYWNFYSKGEVNKLLKQIGGPEEV